MNRKAVLTISAVCWLPWALGCSELSAYLCRSYSPPAAEPASDGGTRAPCDRGKDELSPEEEAVGAAVQLGLQLLTGLR